VEHRLLPVQRAVRLRDKDAILANGDGSNLEFAVIVRPQP
jgi:hypothetical protein